MPYNSMYDICSYACYVYGCNAELPRSTFLSALRIVVVVAVVVSRSRGLMSSLVLFTRPLETIPQANYNRHSCYFVLNLCFVYTHTYTNTWIYLDVHILCIIITIIIICVCRGWKCAGPSLCVCPSLVLFATLIFFASFISQSSV